MIKETFGIFQAESLRKKSSRVEEENESLIMQVKKMATKARSMIHVVFSLVVTILTLEFDRFVGNLILLIDSRSQAEPEPAEARCCGGEGRRNLRRRGHS